jgi:dipeptidase E
MRLLLISNSTMSGEPYLEYPKYEIQKFLGKESTTALFIPYAAVTFSYDTYVENVNERFAEIGHRVVGIHTFDNPEKAVRQASVIIVGGGNTWQLVRKLNDYKLILAIRDKVLSGTPYIGWSAGANVACPTLSTTNDMPIIDPIGFICTNLIPFQINPHYLDSTPEGHGGETREQRILEFIEINPQVYVAGLREGTMFRLEGQKLTLIGSRKCRVFKKGQTPLELSATDDFSFLLHS